LAQAAFEVMESVIRLTLEDGEVGQLIVPIRVHPEVPPARYMLKVRVESETGPGAARLRPRSSENEIERLGIRYPQGLGITQIASWGFEARKETVQELELEVLPAAVEPEENGIAPQFNSIWMPRHWEFVTSAEHEVDERRAHILSALEADRVAVSMLQESPAWFASSGLQLHVAEAIFVAKMLTYTVLHLLRDVPGQECLLVPILAYALANEQPTTDVLWLVTQLGYAHVLEIAIALSFAVLEKEVGQEVWSAAEQRAARDFIIESLNAGSPLPSEFLYLPLILGGLVVAHDMAFEGEDVAQSIGMLQMAKAERSAGFAGEEWQDLDDIWKILVAKQANAQHPA
jgi:hypothetical protein